MKRLLLCLALPSFAIAKAPPSPPPPAWDANLYRNDAAVVSTHFEFLYWKAQEGGLDYALKMNTPAWTTNTSDTTLGVGNFRCGSFDIDPGFRLSISYFRAPKEWEVWGSYTRLTSRGHDSAHKPNSASLFLVATQASPSFLTAALASAKSTTHLNYNVADIIADRYFHPNPHLRLRLIGGLTTAWMSQDWTVLYLTSDPSQSARTRMHWNFAGAGFRFGMMADWFWTSDIYLTARGTVGALMGCYKNQTKETSSVPESGNSNAAIPVSNTTYRDGRATLTMQAMLGPSWQKNFRSTRVEVFAGYEINTWSNLQEKYQSSLNTVGHPQAILFQSSLLSMQGLTTRLTVDF